MAEVRDILGQFYSSSSGTVGELYKVPAAKEAVISSLIAANFATAQQALVRFSAASSTAEPATFKHRLYWDVPVPSNDSLTITAGLTLRASGVIRVAADTTSVAFNAFGAEIDV